MLRACVPACDALDRAIQAGCRAVLYLSTTLLFALLGINVLLRYTLGTSLHAAGELPELLFPWLVMAGVVLAAQHGAHISILWLVEKLPAGARHAVALANGVVLMIGYGVLAWGALELLPVVHGELSNVLKVPGSVTYACLLTGFVLLVLTSLTQVARLLASAERAPSARPAGVPAAP